MLTINDLAQSKLRSSSLDKLHGQRKAIEFRYEGSEAYDFRDDEKTESIRQELEKLTGKTICVIDKGGSFVEDFFNNIKSEKPTELIDLGDFYELKFPDFSLYYLYKAGYYWNTTFMDAREIILPPKSTSERGQKRLYIARINRKLYKLPELEYPKTMVQFLKWAKKKKKITFDHVDLWNYEKKLVFFKTGDSLGRDGAVDWDEVEGGWGSNPFFCEGYPIRNLKTEDDLIQYNTWLLGDYKTTIETSNKIYNKCWKANKSNPRSCYSDYYWERRIIDVPDKKLNPTEITTITQADVDQFINEWNNKYQVKR